MHVKVCCELAWSCCSLCVAVCCCLTVSVPGTSGCKHLQDSINTTARGETPRQKKRSQQSEPGQTLVDSDKLSAILRSFLNYRFSSAKRMRSKEQRGSKKKKKKAWSLVCTSNCVNLWVAKRQIQLLCFIPARRSNQLSWLSGCSRTLSHAGTPADIPHHHIPTAYT